MSRFLPKLRRIWEGKSQPIGFATARTKSPPMALVALLPQGEAGLADLAVKEGVDAVLFPKGNLAGKALHQLSQSLGDIPWGVSVEAVTQEEVARLIEMGCDFLTFSGEVPAALLMEDRLGKMLELEPSLSDSLLRTVASLPIDAVLFGSADDFPLTVRRLMDYRRLANLVGKPSLLMLPSELGVGDLESLWEVGIRGVAVPMEGQRLSQVKEAIQSLPQRRRMRGEADVFLPSIAAEGPDEEEEI